MTFDQTHVSIIGGLDLRLDFACGINVIFYVASCNYKDKIGIEFLFSNVLFITIGEPTFLFVFIDDYFFFSVQATVC